MGSPPDFPSYKPALVGSQNSCSVVGSPDFEAGSRRLLVWALHRKSARQVLPEHALEPVTLAQNLPATNQEWQSEPL